MSEGAQTLYVVDADPAMLESVASLAITVSLPVETFVSAEDFLQRNPADLAGCLITDVRLPRMSGFGLIEALASQNSDLPVIVVSGHGDVPVAVRAIKAGALDFLEKPFRDQELLDAIQTAFAVDRERRTLRRRVKRIAENFDSLTPRELDAMELMVSGKSGREMAAALGISYKTIEKYRGRVLQKMDANSIAELVLIAVDLGMFSGKREFREWRH